MLATCAFVISLKFDFLNQQTACSSRSQPSAKRPSLILFLSTQHCANFSRAGHSSLSVASGRSTRSRLTSRYVPSPPFTTVNFNSCSKILNEAQLRADGSDLVPVWAVSLRRRRSPHSW
jgi:hypothetical protein